MRLRRHKSKKARAADALGSYMKLKTAGKAARGAGKAAKGAAAYQVAKRTPLPRFARHRLRLGARIPLIAGAGVAAFFAARAIRGNHHEQQPA